MKQKEDKIKSKKGVSVVIGYVLLVVIAISLSLLVYAWLKSYIPKDIEECPDDVSLVIYGYTCENKEITLTLRNKGFFNLYGFTARVSEVSGGFSYELKDADGKSMHYFEDMPEEVLKPNEEDTRTFSYAGHNQITEIEIQPFIFAGEEIIMCDNAIIKQVLEECV